MTDAHDVDPEEFDDVEEELIEEAVEEDKKQPLQVDNRSVFTLREQIIKQAKKLDEEKD